MRGLGVVRTNKASFILKAPQIVTIQIAWTMNWLPLTFRPIKNYDTHTAHFLQDKTQMSLSSLPFYKNSRSSRGLFDWVYDNVDTNYK